MAIKNYTTKTAALRATIADVNKLEAKKIKVNGKDVVLGAKHSQDTRETVTENDLWGQYTEIKDGQVIVHDDEVINPTRSTDIAWNNEITKVEDNKAYVGDTFYANIQTEKIKDGGYMFIDCTNLTTFTSDLSSLTNGEGMFWQCSNLSSFTSDSSGSTMDLSSLTNGEFMFLGCSNLSTFTSDLSSLTNGSIMFDSCTNLTTFTSDLSSLVNGDSMFCSCTNLTTFTSDLSSLVNGDSMFCSCTNLTTFTSDLSSLINGKEMFSDCSNLTTFTSDLSSLVGGLYMFNRCKLNPQSVMYIVESINDIAAEEKLYQDGKIPYVTYDDTTKKFSAPKGFTSDGVYVYTYTFDNNHSYITTILPSYIGELALGINVTNDATTIADQLQAFAEEATFDSWEVLKQAFVDKGWNVTWQYGGTSTSITYDLRGERTIPCPIYAQLVEILPQEGEEELTDKQKKRAEYTNEDGTKFYNINWGHDVTHPQEFQQFDSLEDAMVAYGVILKQSIN